MAASDQPATRHVRETLWIGLPLAAATLAQMAMGVTDTILLGRLGPDSLAAGGMGNALFYTVMLVLQAVVGAVSVFVAQARGAGRDADVPQQFWTAALLAVLLCVPAFALLSAAEDLLRLTRQPPAMARDAGVFVDTLRWSVPGAMLGSGLMRGFLPAIGAGWVILPVMLLATAVNAIAGYGLIHGAWGLPALGLRGPAMATVIVAGAAASGLFAAAWARPRWRALVRWSRPRGALLWAMLLLGVPIGATVAVEACLFNAVALLIGVGGPGPLAAHQVAITMISVAFTVPLGLAQAANVRVAHAVGASLPREAFRAGIAAIGLAGGFEFACALVSWLLPGAVVGLYLGDPASPAFRTAVSLLGIAALFQVADGVQCAASGALRGLGDTRVPFLLAAVGYWAIGFPAAWGLAIGAGMGAKGAWWGLAAGLTVTSALLTIRFVRMPTPGR